MSGNLTWQQCLPPPTPPPSFYWGTVHRTRTSDTPAAIDGISGRRLDYTRRGVPLDMLHDTQDMPVCRQILRDHFCHWLLPLTRQGQPPRCPRRHLERICSCCGPPWPQPAHCYQPQETSGPMVCHHPSRRPNPVLLQTTHSPCTCCSSSAEPAWAAQCSCPTQVYIPHFCCSWSLPGPTQFKKPGTSCNHADCQICNHIIPGNSCQLAYWRTQAQANGCCRY